MLGPRRVSQPFDDLQGFYWRLRSSGAGITLEAAVAGVLIAGLFEVASRLRRWKRGRTATETFRRAVGVDPAPIGGLDDAD